MVMEGELTQVGEHTIQFYFSGRIFNIYFNLSVGLKNTFIILYFISKSFFSFSEYYL